MAVGKVVTATMPNMAVSSRGDRHTSENDLMHVVGAASEVQLVDKLLVSGRDPLSLAGLLRKAVVLRRRVGDEVLINAVSFCTKFGL